MYETLRRLADITLRDLVDQQCRTLLKNLLNYTAADDNRTIRSGPPRPTQTRQWIVRIRRKHNCAGIRGNRVENQLQQFAFERGLTSRRINFRADSE
ncbi:MAG: hypothetical protein DMG20_04400 [Acidobacteria bacterium]|nr:MAG: hypothetical protein DMG20_04400 [Acidobacteriota bacterium]